MSNENSTNGNTEETKTINVLGWGNINPSGTLEVPVDMELEDIPYEKQVEVLEQDLKEKGFTDEQIQNSIHIEADELYEE